MTQREVVKSNLSIHNRGICANANSCRYTGQSVVWQVPVRFEGEDVIESAFGFKTKTEATAFAAWLDAEFPGDIPQNVDPVMRWERLPAQLVNLNSGSYDVGTFDPEVA